MESPSLLENFLSVALGLRQQGDNTRIDYRPARKLIRRLGPKSINGRLSADPAARGSIEMPCQPPKINPGIAGQVCPHCIADRRIAYGFAAGRDLGDLFG